MYLAGPFKGAPLSVVAVTPALAGPYDYGVVVVRVALHIDPADGSGLRGLRHGPGDHRRNPDPDALDPGQHRPAQLHDQPDQLRTVHGRLAGDRRPRHGDRLLLLLPGRQLRCLGIQAVDDGQQIGGRKSDQARRRTPDAVRPSHPPGDANIKSLVGDAPERVRDRPAPPRQHLLGERAGCERVRRADRRSARPRRRRRCSTSRSLARSTPSQGRAACRGWLSSSTARSASCRRADTKSTVGKLKTTVPVVPDAPIGHFSLTVFGRKTGLSRQHPEHLQARPGDPGRLRGQNGKKLTRNVKLKSKCGKSPRQAQRSQMRF